MLIQKAKELNFHQVWLSVLDSNQRAICFYKKTGFEKIGNHDFQIGKENFEFIAMKSDKDTVAISKWSTRLFYPPWAIRAIDGKFATSS